MKDGRKNVGRTTVPGRNLINNIPKPGWVHFFFFYFYFKHTEIKCLYSYTETRFWSTPPKWRCRACIIFLVRYTDRPIIFIDPLYHDVRIKCYPRLRSYYTYTRCHAAAFRNRGSSEKCLKTVENLFTTCVCVRRNTSRDCLNSTPDSSCRRAMDRDVIL